MASTIVAPAQRLTPAPLRSAAPGQHTPAPRTALPQPPRPPRQQQAGTPSPDAAHGPVATAHGDDAASGRGSLPGTETELFRKALRRLNELQANIETVLADLDRLQVSVNNEASATSAAKEEFSAGKRALRNLFARKARWRNLCLTKEARRGRRAANGTVAGAATLNTAVAESRHLSTASSNDGPNSSASWE